MTNSECMQGDYRAFRLDLTTARSNKSGVKTNCCCSEFVKDRYHFTLTLFRFIASGMPNSYVEVGYSNRNVMGKNISFCIFPNRVKKKARWGNWVQ